MTMTMNNVRYVDHIYQIAFEIPADVLALANDDSASQWLRANLFELIKRRDPVDALNDAQALAAAMESWSRAVFEAHSSGVRCRDV